MMCRPLRAVMVGHRYAIIVPEVRGIRRAPRSRRNHFADPSHFRSFPLFPFPFSHQRARGERSRGGARTLSVACPATPAGCYSRRRHSPTPGRRDWPPNCTRTGRNRRWSVAGICTRTVTRGNKLEREVDRVVLRSDSAVETTICRRRCCRRRRRRRGSTREVEKKCRGQRYNCFADHTHSDHSRVCRRRNNAIRVPKKERELCQHTGVPVPTSCKKKKD